MAFFLETLIGGLMTGMLYSLVALGFVLIFKASGVFNFAQGAMVLFAALAMARFSGWLPEWTGITDKLVRRHPHVFGDTKVSGTKEVLENWESIKLKEKAAAGGEKKKGLLDGLPRSMPALLRAHEIGERCAVSLFDPRWHQGVVGILAGRIKDRHHRPVIAFAEHAPADQCGQDRKGYFGRFHP